MIRCNDVSVSYQNHTVFQSLQLQLQSHVSYLITGNNGVGKTTLLKLLAGKIQPRQGAVQYDFIEDQLDWDEKFAWRKRFIHFVPAHALHELVNTPDLFYQQRYYTIESTPLPTVRNFLGDRLDRVNSIQLPDSLLLHHLLDLELTRLSNGQVKKLMILKQLLDFIPKVLILDYPFEGLDLPSRLELREFLDYLAATHHIQLIVADHVHPQLPLAITAQVNIRDDGAISLNSFHKASPSSKTAAYVKPERKDTEPVVEMIDVKIQYDHHVILEHLNWKIHRGERWALTGRNGSGKTTLFSLIYADHPMAYSEKVYLFGKRRGTGESIWDIKKRISYLGPEHLHFLDHDTELLTVEQYLKRINAPEKLNLLMDYFQLHPVKNRALRNLSNGQRQLVLMVALFLTQKELLLLDEPFQFLDPKSKQRICDYLETHMDESVTLVLITHYESDVDHWTNHRLML